MRILRVVGSRTLPCGCLVGVYETYAGPCVELLDHLGEHCPVGEHRFGAPSGNSVTDWLRRAGHVLHLTHDTGSEATTGRG